MSVQTNENLISEKLIEQLQKSLASITEKFEELRRMYDKLMESIEQMTKKKSSSDIESINIDNLDRFLDRFKNVQDVEKLSNKLKTKIKYRNNKINTLEDTIEQQNEIIKSTEVEIEELSNKFTEVMQQYTEDVKNKRLEQKHNDFYYEHENDENTVYYGGDEKEKEYQLKKHRKRKPIFKKTKKNKRNETNKAN